MTNQLKQLSEAAAWPREIWMAERHEHDQGLIYGVLSEHATISRFDGDKERDREFHHYIDADIHESAERYHKARYEALEAQLTEARAREAVAYEVAAVHFDPEPYIEDTEGESIARRIRALPPDHTTTALEQIKQEAERAGFERGVRASAAAIGDYQAFTKYAKEPLTVEMQEEILGLLSKPEASP